MSIASWNQLKNCENTLPNASEVLHNEHRMNQMAKSKNARKQTRMKEILK